VIALSVHLYKGKKMNTASYERRDYEIEKIELRDTDKGQVISGIALPFNRSSGDLGGFVETIHPDAVNRTLENSDVVMLWQHDSTDPITRESTGLRLEIREQGVYFEANASDFTERQRDLLQRGVVKQMSFGFLTVKDEWQQESEPVVRTLLDIDLREISPVTWPAYNQTSVAVRSAESAGITLKNEESVLAAELQNQTKPSFDGAKLKLLTVDADLDD
tara:strand:+ start:4691 stop:5347 length:657 start_codon:yes stop_codon:yes gene_type:complete